MKPLLPILITSTIILQGAPHMSLPRKNDEQVLQEGTATFIRLRAPNAIAFHIPNGGYRTARAAAEMKRSGVYPGAPDWTFVLLSGKVAFVELKTPTGTLSLAQKEFQAACEAHNASYTVIRSVKDFAVYVEELIAAGLIPAEQNVKTAGLGPQGENPYEGVWLEEREGTTRETFEQAMTRRATDETK